MRHCAWLALLAASLFPWPHKMTLRGRQMRRPRKRISKLLEYLQQHMSAAALESFKKADKQDDGHCLACQKKMIKYGLDLQDWKTAETAGEEMVAEAQGTRALAIAHYEFGIMLMDEGLAKPG